jgi:hypothetical protein
METLALFAMTDDHITERTVNFEPHGATKTSALDIADSVGWHGNPPPS